jgi:hypothetical protein
LGFAVHLYNPHRPKRGDGQTTQIISAAHFFKVTTCVLHINDRSTRVCV